jgi:hypothetical protein
MSLSDEEVGIAPPAPPAQTSLSDADVGLAPAPSGINPKLIANVAALDARRSDTFFQSIRNHVEPVLSAFGQGFREGWGPDRLGMSPEDTKWLSEKGIYAPAGATKYDNPFQAMNELLGETIWSAGQIVGRGLPATYRGVQAALVERGVNRDVVSIPDAFMGTPHPTGIPKTLPEVPRTSIGELAAGERPATMRDLAQARELKVTGPQPPRADLPPAEAAAQAIQPTVAYHGSPHDFAAFSSDKIGTGEGAQSYGHGLYFAEHPNVAEGYKNIETTVGGQVLDHDNPVHEAVHKKANFPDPIASLKDDIARGDNPEVKQQAIEILQSGKPLPEIGSGNMYQVRIHADREAMLDWDKPLSEQPENVRNALKRAFKNDLTDPSFVDTASINAGDWVKNMEAYYGDDAAVSKAMHDAGIPGIKYLDQGSRVADDIDNITNEINHLNRQRKNETDAIKLRDIDDQLGKLHDEADALEAKKPTRNFVVFNDKDVEITHKNGEPVDPQMSSAPAPQRAAAAARTGDDVLKGPKPGEEPTGNPWQERFDKFVGKLNTGEDVQNLIRDAARDNDGFQAARTGDVPLGHVESLAEAAGVAPDTVDPRGIGRVMKNDNEVRIGMRLMLQATENVRAAAREVKADGSPESLIRLQEAMMRRDLAVEQIVGLRAEWGRTGNVFQEFQKNVKDQETLSSFLKDKGRTPQDLVDIANGLDQLDGTQAARVLSDLHNRSPGLVHWTWVNGLISGWLTHTKYVAANALYAGTEHGVVTPLAAMIGKAKQAFGAEVDRVYFGEAGAAAYGMIAAVPNAIFATAKSVYSGQRTILRSEIELHKEAVARGDKVPPLIDRAVNQVSGQGRPEMFQNSDVWGKLQAGEIGAAAKDVLGRTLGAPGDMAMGIHTFFKILGERAGLEAEAYSAAAKEGLSPADSDFWRRRAELSANPTSDMRERALAGAYKGTFMGELGPKGRAWQKFTKDMPGLKWVFPFSHIPLNLMKATYEQTPLAVLDSEMRASITGKNGGAAQDRAIARMVAGSAVMAYFVNASLNGRATGDYPSDPAERDNWKLTGKQPNSILIGGYWTSYNKFGPAGDLANLAANLGHVIPMLRSHDDDAMTKATWSMASSAAHVVSDEVGFQSLSNLFEAMHDEKKGAAWAASTAASFIPFSSALGQTASFHDPYMREAKGFIDGIKSKLPGQRETLLPKRDWLGQPVPNPQFGNIIRQRQALTDPLSTEMDRLQIHPGLPADRIGGVKLTRPLYDEFQVLAGAYTKTALDSLVNAPNFEELPTSVRINVIHANIRSSRQIAESMMQVKHPELIGQGMQQRIDFITGKSLTARPKKAPEAVSP